MPPSRSRSRLVFNPVQKRWSHENSRQGLLDSGFEIRYLCGPADRSSLASRVQHPEPAGERPARESSRRSAARRRALIGVSGLAHEDALAARRIACPGRAERPIDHDRVDAATWT